MSGAIELSPSSWRQRMPREGSPAREAVVDSVATRVIESGTGRVTVAIDGFSAAGKTNFGHELARTLSARGRQVLRASLDDFKRPWDEADQYDRTSGEGYYRNAFDYDAVRRLLLDPARPGGSGRAALCAIDPITQVDRSDRLVRMRDDAVVVVDGVFTMRPELDGEWDVRVWLDVDAELSVKRAIARDAKMVGGARAAEDVQRNRYLASELIYIDECDPRHHADVVIDNSQLDDPKVERI
ncbi:MAG TPA: uridine kinase [Acidimicrobiia bacterium]|jgi:uridine kinase